MSKHGAREHHMSTLNTIIGNDANKKKINDEKSTFFGKNAIFWNIVKDENLGSFLLESF